MPEIPDVEVLKRYLDSTALDQRIDHVTVERGNVLQHTSARALRRHLEGHRIEESRRHGKLLFARLDGDGGWLLLHFGMTGFLKYYEKQDEAPGHARVVLHFENGRHLAYDATRMLGEVDLVEDPQSVLASRRLGPDALDIEESELVRRLRGRRGSIKSALMNQGILSGLGNVYSDEILFQAELHPATPVGALDDEELRGLYRVMRAIIEQTVEAGADPSRLPESWLLPHRRPGESCPRCGGTLRRLHIAGRSAWLCPSCQKRRQVH